MTGGSFRCIYGVEDLPMLEKKLKSKLLKPLDYYYILIVGNDLPDLLKEGCLRLIKELPGVCIQILNISCQLNPAWKRYEFDQESHENSGFLSKVRVIIDDHSKVSKPVFTVRKQTGRYESAFNFICDCKNGTLIDDDVVSDSDISVSSVNEKNFVSELNEIVQKKRWVMDINEMVVKKGAYKEYVVTITIHMKDKVISVSGNSHFKKQAKNDAIEKLFNQYQDDLLLGEEIDDMVLTKNYIGLLQEIIQVQQWPMVTYSIGNYKLRTTIDKMNHYNFDCRAMISIDDRFYRSKVCFGKTKKGAKQEAAKSLLEVLSCLVRSDIML